MAISERGVPSMDGSSPLDIKGSAVQNVELTGFPFPGDLGPKMSQLNERGRGRVIAFATRDTSEQIPQARAFIFAVPYRASNRVGGPETEVLLISPSLESPKNYRFVVVTPKSTTDDLIDFGAMLMPSKTPYVIIGWKPEYGKDPLGEFIKSRHQIAPSIGTEHEIRGRENQGRVWVDAIGRTEALAAKQIAVDENSLKELVGSDIVAALVRLDEDMVIYEGEMTGAMGGFGNLPDVPSTGLSFGEDITDNSSNDNQT